MLLAVALLLPAVAAAQEAVNWSGAWDSRWRGGGAVLFLQQTADRVEGTYPALGGTIRGRVDGRILSGEWSDPGGTGSFTFAMAPDGRTFMGRFGTGEWWTAERRAPGTLRAVGATDARTPASALRSFLQAGNETRDGRSDRLGPALLLLDFSEFENELTPAERLRYATMLFRILDQLTFRVWEVRPPSSDVVEFTHTLRQAGTRVPFALTFRLGERRDEPFWSIVVPTGQQMELALERLLARTGGELPHIYEHHDLQSPRDTLRTFIEKWYSNSPEADATITRTMDLNQLAAAVRQEEGMLRAQFLKEVLDRIGYVLWQEIDDNRERRAPYLHFRHPDGIVELVRGEQDDGSHIWQFSAETVANVRPLFMALEDMPADEGVALTAISPFFELRNQIRAIDRNLLMQVGPMELWQWLALTVYLLVSIPVSWVLAWIVAKLFRLKRTSADRLSAHARFLWPLRVIFVAQFGTLAIALLGLPQAVELPLRFLIGLAVALAGGWFAFHLVDKVGSLYAEHSSKIGYRDEMLRSLGTSTMKLVVIIGAALYLAEVLSIPWQGVIAGLGVGGIAVALAAQGTVANFIGGLTLFADKPIKVGDFCRFGDQVGTVEGLGLRSVKIRSLDRTVVTIPNAEFVNMALENFGRRDMILLRTTIELRYETTPDQLRWVLQEFRKLLLQHPKVTDAPARARFEGFGAHSLNIGIFAYVRTPDINEFLAIQEDIYLRMIDIVDRSGTGFAFPSNVTYLARDTGIDAERKQRVEAIVAKLRESDELPFPNFDQDAVYGMMDQMEYPSAGSVHSRRAMQRRTQPQAAD
ncbi:MAG: mechanosensitive ion channel family protein [Geminicoccaceae bacterium]|nr:MAG: mechanosensitive ion channel family protein [Geminicoccaceae bacterium]